MSLPPDFWDKVFGRKPPSKWEELHRAMKEGRIFIREHLTIGQINAIRKMYPYSVTGVIIYKEKTGENDYTVYVIPPQAVPPEHIPRIYGSEEQHRKYVKSLLDWIRKQGY